MDENRKEMADRVARHQNDQATRAANCCMIRTWLLFPLVFSFLLSSYVVCSGPVSGSTRYEVRFVCMHELIRPDNNMLNQM